MGAKVERNQLVTMGLMLFFVLVAFGLYELLIAKDMDSNVAVSNKLAFQKSITSYIQKTQKSLEASSKGMDGSQLAQIDEELLRTLLANFLQKPNIKLLDQGEQKSMRRVRYYVEGYVDTPKKLYDLVEYLHTKHYPLLLETPLKMERMGNQIKVGFFVAVYQDPR